MKKVIHKFRDMPVALTGLALGISGISGALGTFLGDIPIYIDRSDKRPMYWGIKTFPA